MADLLTSTTYFATTTPVPDDNMFYRFKRGPLSQEDDPNSVDGVVMQKRRIVMRTDSLIVEALLGQADALDSYAMEIQQAAALARTLENQREQIAHDMLTQIPDPLHRAEAFATMFSSKGSRHLLLPGMPLSSTVSYPDAPLQRLAVGKKGRVRLENPKPSCVRQLPGLNADLETTWAPGKEFAVIFGPVYKDGFLWWMVESAPTRGWCAEGEKSYYYLEPLEPREGEDNYG